jgi:methyltransferase family protein
MMQWTRLFKRRAASLPVIHARRAHDFASVERLASGIDGMMSIFSMQVMDSVLSFQAELNVAGHVVEFGVYKGRSAAVLSAHVTPPERLILVDVEKLITEETLSKLFTRAEFVLGRSEEYSRTSPDYPDLRSAVRFLHVDSSHTFRTTLAEMRLADELLSPDGIVCLDDYTNLNYSQILPAIYKYLFTNDTDLTVFLVTDIKCYICRRKFFDRYAGFVLQRILPALAERGNTSVSIARTDRDEEYKAFYVRPKDSPDEGDRYGESIYGHFYLKP